MLVLSRKIGESIVIGDDIVVKVISSEGSVVKLGIDAPRSIAIMRSELLEQIEESNRASVGKSNDDDLVNLSKILGKK